jgi:hypothetical protein
MTAGLHPELHPPERVNSGLKARLCRIFLILFLVAVVWAAVVALTGGFTLKLGLIRLRSRSPWNVVIIAALMGVVAGVLAPPGRRRQAVIAELDLILRWVASPLRDIRGLAVRLAPFLAGITAVAVVVLGFWKGAFVAGGADSYGYLSQAHLWAQGQTQIEQPIMTQLSWPFSDMALSPLGYRPAPHGPFIVPVYAPGLPMAMALFERIAGPRAVFYVVPLLGGIAVWATYLMGAAIAGPLVGLSAAVLLTTSPVFLYQLMYPMSDIPVTAWWTLCLVLLPIKRRGAALAAGVFAGIAILTRPNLVFVLLVPGMFLLWAAVTDRSDRGRAVRRLLLFVAGAIPACFVVAYLNAKWYGGVLSNGYGSLDYLYGPENLWPNMTRYSMWLLDSETPVVLLALLAPFFLRPQSDTDSGTYGSRAVAVTWLLFIAAVAACYAFYAPFEVWWYLRFFLPVFPPMLVLTSIGLNAAATLVARAAGGLVAAVVVAIVVWHGVRFATANGAFGFQEGERKYVAVGEYVGSRLPDRAAFICMQYSGSIRYYSGRLTVRYDWIPPNRLDSVVEQLRGLGYHPYIVLEAVEMSTFQRRFQEASKLGTLNWTPRARLKHDADVKIYDPADQRSGSDHQPITDIIN